jgi:uncharacterized protein YndB with AHSA1/START domain
MSPVLSSPRIEIHRSLRASPERVFAAWSQADQWQLWFGAGVQAAAGGRSQSVLDPRVGGLWHATMTAPDGALRRVHGVFHELTPPARLVFTWQWDDPGSKAQLVTVAIAAEGGGSRLTLLHEALPDEPSRAGHEQGWLAAVERIELLVTAAAPA